MSTEFLKVNDYERRPSHNPSHHRSRSNGYADDEENRERRDRREYERATQRYHDGTYYTPLSSRRHQRSTSDYLRVPEFRPTVSNTQSNENVSWDRDETPRAYNLQEIRPRYNPYDFDLSSEPVSSSQLPVLYVHQQQQQKNRSGLNVQIHHDSPSVSISPASSSPSWKPRASSHSPTVRPQMQRPYIALQNRLAQIGSTCAPYAEVEAIYPQDLTFAKISEHVDGFAFDLHVWAHTVCLNDTSQIESQNSQLMATATRCMERLLSRVVELDDACARAKPRDLKIDEMPITADEELYDEEEEEDRSISNPTESLAFVIHSALHSIELQIRTLKRLTRSLQEATAEAGEEVVATTKLVDQVVQYFGSNAALDEYGIDTRFAGGKALEEAKYASAH